MARIKKIRGGHKKKAIDVIDKTFELYNNKTESDYWINNGDERIPTQATVFTKEDIGLYKVYRQEDNRDIIVYENEFVERLSPDNLDCCKFWKTATDKFPLFSIAGGIQTIQTIDELNNISLCSASALGVLKVVDYIFQENKKAKFLEIGPGHGGLQQAIAKYHGDDNYYAIDVNPLFKHPRIFQTDGKTIPDTIPCELDCVYSVNVFQHLSKAQRTSYYRQIFTALKTGGLFVFGMFVINDQNKDWPVWGTRDVNGKVYCNFFKQLTEVDWEENLVKELTDLGYKVMAIPDTRDKSHYLCYICQTT
jgi:SAM-dependent methyltransferase